MGYPDGPAGEKKARGVLPMVRLAAQESVSLTEKMKGSVNQSLGGVRNE